MARPLSFLLFFAVALAVLGGMHGYLWLRLVRDTGLPEPWRRLATWALVLAALLVPAGMFAARLAGQHISRVLPLAAFVWMGLSFLIFAALLVADAGRLLAWGATQLGDWVRNAPDAPPDPARRQLLARAVAGGALVAAGAAGAASLRSAAGPAVIEEVPVRLARLPRALSGFTLAQVTDLHVGPTIREREVRRVVEQVNGLRPDAVVITGDLVDGSTRELGPIVAELGRLSARHGVYFVTGNHEYYSGVEAWADFLAGLGVRVLRNQRVALGDGAPGGATFDLAGVNDWSAGPAGTPHGMDLPRALAGRDPERSLVLLAHQPRGVDEAVRQGVELQVSGHTHGGQLFPWNFAVRAAFPYVKGLYRAQGAPEGQVYVSRGTGYWGPPMRLGSPPEITRLVLTS
ncbi:MAG: metallophosphoesterase [Anaeromyxobacter sp.]|nr:metallophosphoesterase [Anaeromyxobacter sp.]MBL0275536.1 metallophosphoesterase [Anaeromyxobacter sp.]